MGRPRPNMHNLKNHIFRLATIQLIIHVFDASLLPNMLHHVTATYLTHFFAYFNKIIPFYNVFCAMIGLIFFSLFILIVNFLFFVHSKYIYQKTFQNSCKEIQD